MTFLSNSILIIHKRKIFTAGFALFSMFFGSGNLVFPLFLGQQTAYHSPFAILGLMITAVMIPFLGFLGMIFYNGKTNTYFESLGAIPSLFLMGMMLCLMGPFGVVPRCISVSYGSLICLFPDLSYPLFSFVFCCIIIVFIWYPNTVVDLIGLLLTPFKLGGVLLLLIYGLWFGGALPPSSLSKLSSFTKGLVTGYQTMDLMAAFFFSATIVQYLQNRLQCDNSQKVLLKMSCMASLIGGCLLALVYVGFVFLGGKYSLLLESTAPEAMLSVIATHTLGAYALFAVAITMTIACLPTAVILSTLFVDFFHKEICGNHFSRPCSVFFSLSVTFCVSLLGFSIICQALGGILEIIYPALVVLAITNLLNKLFSLNQGKIPFWITLGGSGAVKLFEISM